MSYKKPLSLKINFAWVFLGNLIYSSCQWGMLIVIAKLGSPEMLGVFSLGLAITTPLFKLTNLELRTFQAVDSHSQFQFSDYLSLRLFSTGIGIVILIAILIISGYTFEKSAIIMIIGLAKAFESISDVYYGLLQNKELMNRIAISMIIKGILSLLFLGIGLYITKTIVFGCAGLAIAWAILLFSYDLKSEKLVLDNGELDDFSNKKQDINLNRNNEFSKFKINFKTKKNNLTKLFITTFPLGFVMMLTNLCFNMPRYSIEHYWGERQLGIFAALSYLLQVGYTIVSSLGNSASPRLAKFYAGRQIKEYTRLLLNLLFSALVVGLVLLIAAILFGKEIISIMYSPEYSEYSDVFIWIMIVGIMRYIYTFIGTGITAALQFKILMPLTLFVTLISAILCLLLVPKFGLIGAAVSLLITDSIKILIGIGVIVNSVNKLKQIHQNSIS